MSLGYIDSSAFTNIADAIRQKKGTANSMTPSQMPQEIATITTGSLEWVEGGVNFVDWDGTLLYSYTLEQAHNLTELPPLPNNYKDYTAYSWTENLAFVKALTVPWMVGVEYTTPRVSTRIFITVPSDCLEVYWMDNHYINNNYEKIDWGDGTSEIKDKTSESAISHSYPHAGDYTITVWDTDSTGTDVEPWQCSTGDYPIIMTAFEYEKRFLSAMSSGQVNIKFCLITSVELGTGFCLYGKLFLGQFNMKKCLIPYSSNASSDFNAFNGPVSGAAFRYSGIENLVFPVYIPLLSKSLPNVKNIVIPFSLQNCSLDSRYSGDSALEHINWWPSLLSNSGTYMTYTFKNCWNLKNKVNVPDGITSIQYCFSNANDSYIYNSYGGVVIDGNIPSSVTSFSNAFYFSFVYGDITINTTNITSSNYMFYLANGILRVHFKATTPPTLGSSAFGSAYSSSPLIYVPYSADHSVLNAYKTASGWSTYASRIFEEPAS